MSQHVGNHTFLEQVRLSLRDNPNLVLLFRREYFTKLQVDAEYEKVSYWMLEFYLSFLPDLIKIQADFSDLSHVLLWNHFEVLFFWFQDCTLIDFFHMNHCFKQNLLFKTQESQKREGFQSFFTNYLRNQENEDIDQKHVEHKLKEKQIMCKQKNLSFNRDLLRTFMDENSETNHHPMIEEFLKTPLPQNEDLFFQYSVYLQFVYQIIYITNDFEHFKRVEEVIGKNEAKGNKNFQDLIQEITNYYRILTDIKQ